MISLENILRTEKRTLIIVIPGLFEGLSRWPDNQSEENIAPGLLSLLSKSSKYCHPHRGYERTLIHCYASRLLHDEELPIALFRMPSVQQAMLCADPVSLQLGVSDINLVYGQDLALSNEDIEALTQYLNTLLIQENMQWELGPDGYGVLKLEESPRISTTPLSSVNGEIFIGKLPRGEGHTRWHRLGNEIQMMLHNCSLNQRREAEGKLPINTLWFWGAGSKLPEFDTFYDRVYADDKTSQSLASYLDSSIEPVPESMMDLQQQITEGSTMLVLDKLWTLSQKDDFLGWRDQLASYEMDWFQPLIRQMSQPGISSLQIRTSSGESFNYRAIHRYRFWRQQRSLRYYQQS